METSPSGGTEDAAALFERALALFRDGDAPLAQQAALAVVARAPGHVGGMMLLLAATAGTGDEAAISATLLEISDHYERLLGVPEVLELFESDALAPVVRCHAFRTVFAPALRGAQRQTCDAADRELARCVQEAIRDAAVEESLRSAPVFRREARPRMDVLRVVDLSTGRMLAVLDGDIRYVAGRGPDATIRVDHPSVSRRQFRIEHRLGTWFVQNLSTTNRTLVNGQPIGGAWTAVEDGDELQAGAVSLDLVGSASVFRVGPAPSEVLINPYVEAAPARDYVPGSSSRTRSMERALPVSSSMSTTTPWR